VTTESNADNALVFAQTGIPDSGKRVISAFIIPTKTTGYIVARAEDKMGQRVSYTCQIVLEDYAGLRRIERHSKIVHLPDFSTEGLRGSNG
jgi:alkylation response protein AidB-like acyl-CoA dehydrogenase